VKLVNFVARKGKPKEKASQKKVVQKGAPEKKPTQSTEIH
jgi:hypothetical protein